MNKKFNPIIDRKAEKIMQRATSMSAMDPDGKDTLPSCLDIEDLVKLGKQHDICPYYFSKSQLAASDVLILPY
jgi:hypothetical protein